MGDRPTNLPPTRKKNKSPPKSGLKKVFGERREEEGAEKLLAVTDCQKK